MRDTFRQIVYTVSNGRVTSIMVKTTTQMRFDNLRLQTSTNSPLFEKCVQKLDTLQEYLSVNVANQCKMHSCICEVTTQCPLCFKTCCIKRMHMSKAAAIFSM